ncbi:carbohydrate binding domain-containing protein [Pontibacter sp. G13]|uniref:carbohydrate binding domain-containing protein n=1 Tax=Pontibacter sp. G13 TaxID=3074898 RepID=UPI00288BC7AC|nr:carbohydrate binding domain-containing protein [Pontibacter sp. G13]WNJ21071.1 carbohydrate binding domain-containing protein [Pontibacter sp. G13]
MLKNILGLLALLALPFSMQAQTCSDNIAPGHGGFESPLNTIGWSLWDGGANASSMNITTAEAHHGDQSVHISVPGTNSYTDFHHRFTVFTIDEDSTYQLSFWVKSNASDSIQLQARVVRDTDWQTHWLEQMAIASGDWTQFAYTFTAYETWNVAFLEFKFTHHLASGSYEVWMDEVELCKIPGAITNIDGDLASGVRLYPNPVHNGRLSIELPASHPTEKLQLRDMQGRVLRTWHPKAQSPQVLDCTSIPNGIYLLEIISGNAIMRERVEIRG